MESLLVKDRVNLNKAFSSKVVLIPAFWWLPFVNTKCWHHKAIGSVNSAKVPQVVSLRSIVKGSTLYSKNSFQLERFTS